MNHIKKFLCILSFVGMTCIAMEDFPDLEDPLTNFMRAFEEKPLDTLPLIENSSSNFNTEQHCQDTNESQLNEKVCTDQKTSIGQVCALQPAVKKHRKHRRKKHVSQSKTHPLCQTLCRICSTPIYAL